MHAFDVLGDPVRRRILELVAGGEMSAGEISDVIEREHGISQPAVSQHLRVLRENGFARVRAEGTRRFYAVQPDGLHDVDAWLDRFRSFWTPPLDALATELAARQTPEPEDQNMIDVVEQINAVQRTIGSRVLEAGEARTVTIGQSYDAGIDDLWDACTNAERIPRWFRPISGELRLHGHYAIEGNASGTIERCDPPNGFGATWEYDGKVSWIEVRLRAEPDGRTRFELEHVMRADDDAIWTEFGPGAVGVGWDLTVMGLFIHLTSRQAIDPAEVEAWSGSEAGMQFVVFSSDRWCAAYIAAGADPDAARAAADRTAKAYTAFGPEEGS